MLQQVTIIFIIIYSAEGGSRALQYASQVLYQRAVATLTNKHVIICQGLISKRNMFVCPFIVTRRISRLFDSQCWYS